MRRKAPEWQPDVAIDARLETLFREYRVRVEENLRPLVERYYPAMLAGNGVEYRKMLELSAKMTLVGSACAGIAGCPCDERRVLIGALFGACCFLGDSFLDDFGEKAAREYLERYGLLLTKGWFEVRNDRERLFYITMARMFAERDVLDPMLRQALLGLYLCQKLDVELRSGSVALRARSRRRQLQLLRQCGRERSGHAITILTLLLVPNLPLAYHCLIYMAGSLITYIDDHGDCHYDRYYNRLTYMNQVRRPVPTLRAIFRRTMERLYHGLPESEGRDLLIAFLCRYYSTRLRKHRLEKSRGVSSWTVYQ